MGPFLKGIVRRGLEILFQGVRGPHGTMLVGVVSALMIAIVIVIGVLNSPQGFEDMLPSIVGGLH